MNQKVGLIEKQNGDFEIVFHQGGISFSGRISCECARKLAFDILKRTEN